MNDANSASRTGPATATPPIGLGRSSTITGRPLLPGRLQHQAQRADVGIESGADILDVVDQDVQPLQALGRRLPGLAVEAQDRQAGLLVLAVGHLGIDAPRMPCSGLNSRTSRTPGAQNRAVCQIDVLFRAPR